MHEWCQSRTNSTRMVSEQSSLFLNHARILYNVQDMRMELIEQEIYFSLMTMVVILHHLSDHHLMVCDLKLGEKKTPTPNYLARNIKVVDRYAFIRLLRLSDPAATVDGLADQIEKATTDLLNSVAPAAWFTAITPRLHVYCLQRQKWQSGMDKRWSVDGIEQNVKKIESSIGQNVTTQDSKDKGIKCHGVQPDLLHKDCLVGHCFMTWEK